MLHDWIRCEVLRRELISCALTLHIYHARMHACMHEHAGGDRMILPLVCYYSSTASDRDTVIVHFLSFSRSQLVSLLWLNHAAAYKSGLSRSTRDDTENIHTIFVVPFIYINVGPKS